MTIARSVSSLDHKGYGDQKLRMSLKNEVSLRHMLIFASWVKIFS
jgi:hypothetical protein